MLTSIRAALVALVATATAVSATPGLSLKVVGPKAVNGVENLKVSATLTNTGDETLKLLNDPRGALHTFPANTFSITTESGGTPSFIGAKVKYVPKRAAKSTDAKSFTILAPGESVTVEHDLWRAYNFTNPGEGLYTVEASNRFHYVDSKTDELVEIRADAETHIAALAGNLAIARPIVAKRASFNGCSTVQRVNIAAAALSAQNYAANAFSYLQQHTSSSSRYTTWFGSWTALRHSTVLSHFANLNDNRFASFTYDCTCTEPDTFAYVFGEFGHIYLCGAFWRTTTTGTDSRAGTIIHESSHFTRNAGTQDYAYGQTNAKNLAKSNPSQAVMNADSHEYFAENTPWLS